MAWVGLLLLIGRHTCPLPKSELDMRCYDCLQEARSDTTGIGVCSRCGLATCENHIRACHVPVTVRLVWVPRTAVSRYAGWYATPATWPRRRTDRMVRLSPPHHRSPMFVRACALGPPGRRP